MIHCFSFSPKAWFSLISDTEISEKHNIHVTSKPLLLHPTQPASPEHGWSKSVRRYFPHSRRERSRSVLPLRKKKALQTNMCRSLINPPLNAEMIPLKPVCPRNLNPCCSVGHHPSYLHGLKYAKSARKAGCFCSVLKDLKVHHVECDHQQPVV